MPASVLSLMMMLACCSCWLQILDHLLSVTHMGAALALPGVLALVAALARDLQAEFVQAGGRLAKVLRALAVLLDVQGGYHNPDVIEQVRLQQ
jgi:uncharacterized membrane protein AbrB (regulator of aidB expression)